MKNLIRESFRRMAHWPVFDRIAARVEDRMNLSRIAGSAEKQADVRKRLEACRTPAEFLEFVRPVLPPTQIASEICGLLELARERQVRRILEIGTAQGGTTLLMSVAIPTVEWIATIDLLPRNPSVLRFFNEPRRTFHSLGGSSRSARVLSAVASIMSGSPLDLLFVDGDHSYEGVAADFECYKGLVRPGGLVVFHDIVPAAETGLPTQGHRWVGGVPRFWQEIKARHPKSWEFVGDWKQGGFGIGVIEYDGKGGVQGH